VFFFEAEHWFVDGAVGLSKPTLPETPRAHESPAALGGAEEGPNLALSYCGACPVTPRPLGRAQGASHHPARSGLRASPSPDDP
jgi:hypothetical protein